MNGLILAPPFNHPDYAADATGEFQPKAREFGRLHGVQPTLFDNPNGKAPFGVVLNLIRRARGPLDFLAYFGHGTPERLESANIGLGHLPALAAALLGSSGIRIIFYACAAGEPGGFAEWLSNLMGVKATIYGHTGYGRSCSRPHVMQYPGRAWVIAPDDPLFSAWGHALDSTDLWARFPFMKTDEIRIRLSAATL